MTAVPKTYSEAAAHGFVKGIGARLLREHTPLARPPSGKADVSCFDIYREDVTSGNVVKRGPAPPRTPMPNARLALSAAFSSTDQTPRRNPVGPARSRRSRRRTGAFSADRVRSVQRDKFLFLKLFKLSAGQGPVSGFYSFN